MGTKFMMTNFARGLDLAPYCSGLQKILQTGIIFFSICKIKIFIQLRCCCPSHVEVTSFIYPKLLLSIYFTDLIGSHSTQTFLGFILHWDLSNIIIDCYCLFIIPAHTLNL